MVDFLRSLNSKFPDLSESRQAAEYILLIDDEGCKEWWRFPEISSSEGRMSKADSLSRHWMLVQMPPLIWLRPLHPQFPLLNVDAAKVVSDSERIAGQLCIKVREETPNQVRVVWLDPAIDFLPRRLSHFDSAEGLVQLDFTYREDAVFGWIPEGWTVVLGPSERLAKEYPGRGLLRQFASFRVEEITKSDVNLTTSDENFPVGTLVIDEPARTFFRQTHHGRREPLSPGEWSRLSDQINDPSTRWRQIAWSGAGLGMLALIAFAFRRRIQAWRSV